MLALALALAAIAFDASARPGASSGNPVNGLENDSPAYASRNDVMRFADEVAQRQGLEASWVRAALERARFIPSVARLVMPAPRGTAKNWLAYRSRFVEPVRIGAGLAFWQANQRWLDLAEKRFGVPAEIVVGIIGVETIYGRQMGNFRIIDALATLAFDFPNGRSDRSGLFRDELEQFLLLCRRQDVNPLDWRGSYAGAIGMPQFLPSSFNQHAVDLDGDGRIDLHDNPADVIGSVANYLMAFGWQRGMATRFDVAPPVDAQQRAVLLAPDILPTFRAEEFAFNGASLGAPAGTFADLLALVELENGEAAPSYVAGTANFYAITRYNRSSYYALAVIELGEAIAREMRR